MTAPDSAAVQSATPCATSAHPGPVAAAAFVAIDPGHVESAYAVIDYATRRPIDFGKIPNHRLLDRLDDYDFDTGDRTIEHVAIEMIASYGMPVGAEVFETCVWIGRYQQVFYTHGGPGFPVELVKRLPVKVHHCHDSKAKDSNITQALVDRFAPGQPNHGKGTKAAPGWFYGFKADVWQAYALAVYVADTTVSVSVSDGTSLPVPEADTDPHAAALSPDAAPAPHPNPMPRCGATPTPGAGLEGEASRHRDTTSEGSLW